MFQRNTHSEDSYLQRFINKQITAMGRKKIVQYTRRQVELSIVFNIKPIPARHFADVPC